MKKLLLFLLALLMLPLVLVACQQHDSQGNNNSSVGMYGTVITIDKEKKQIELDITAWSREYGDLSNDNDVGVVEVIELEENTLIKHDNGKAATLDDIYEKQKITLVENEVGDVKELILTR